jgi:hypothetical protein
MGKEGGEKCFPFPLNLFPTGRLFGSPGIMGKNVHHVTNSQKMGYDGLIISG